MTKNVGVVSGRSDIGTKSYIDDLFNNTPSYVTKPKSGVFEQTLSVYNYKNRNTRRLNAALGRAYAGSGAAHLFFPGDSETDCFDGGGSGGFDQLGAWPIILRGELGLAVGGDGFVRSASFGTVADPRWTYSGTWTKTGQNTANSTNSGDYAIFRSRWPSTSLDVCWSDASGPFTISIDGQTSGRLFTSVTPGATFAWNKTTYTGLPNTTHSVKITQTSASSLAIRGVNAYSSTGVHVHNVAEYGFQTAQWVDLSTTLKTQPINEAYLTPSTMDCVFFAIGANDINNAVALSTITANITTYRNRYSTSDFILFIQPHPSGFASQSTWEGLADAYYTLADTLDCPLIDLYDLFGTYTIANTNGVMTDTVHLNTAGERAWGTLVGQIIGGNMASVLTSNKTSTHREISRTLWR